MRVLTVPDFFRTIMNPMKPRGLSLVALTLTTILTSHAYGGAWPDSLFLKNGEVVVSEVQHVNPWALTLSNDTVVSIKSVSRIGTTNIAVVLWFRWFYPKVSIAKMDSMFVLSVGDLQLLPAGYAPKSMDLSVERGEKDLLMFKNGTTAVSEIREINPWSVTLEDDSVVAIKQLRGITTQRSEVVITLQSYYHNLAILENDSAYAVSLESLSLLPAIQPRFVNRYTFLANYASTRAENVELQINVSPLFARSLVFQLAGSTGTNLRQDSNYGEQIAFGVGYGQQWGRVFVVPMVSMAQSFLVAKDESISKLTWFVSTYASTTFFGQRLAFSVGGRYYLSSIPVDGYRQRLSIIIGLGANFELGSE
jgi:hypothetical protein